MYDSCLCSLMCLLGAQILSHLVSAAGENKYCLCLFSSRCHRLCDAQNKRLNGGVGEKVLVRVGMVWRIVGHDSRRHVLP